MKESEIQKLAVQKLERDGFTYWFPPRTWGERDILGVFDFIGIKERHIILVQITTISHLSHRRKKITDFYERSRIQLFPNNVFIWAWDKRINAFKIEKIIKR